MNTHSLSVASRALLVVGAIALCVLLLCQNGEDDDEESGRAKAEQDRCSRQPDRAPRNEGASSQRLGGGGACGSDPSGSGSPDSASDHSHAAAVVDAETDLSRLGPVGPSGSGLVAGVVRTADGRPLPGLIVEADVFSVSIAGVHWVWARETTTDDKGRFRFDDIADKVTSVTLSISGLPKGMCEPGCVGVRVGETEVCVIVTEGRTIRGRVRGLPRAAVKGHKLYACALWTPTDGDGRSLSLARVSVNGAFQITGVPVCVSARVCIDWRDLGGLGMICRPIWVGPTENDVVLDLETGAEVAGTIVPGEAGFIPQEHRVALLEERDLPLYRISARRVELGRAGEFSFFGVPPGTYRIWVEHLQPEGSSFPGSSPVVGMITDVAPGETDLRLELWRDPYSVPVRVCGGAPGGTVRVYANAAGIDVASVEGIISAETAEYTAMMLLPTRCLEYEFVARASAGQLAMSAFDPGEGIVSLALREPAVIEGRAPQDLDERWFVFARRGSCYWRGRRTGRFFRFVLPEGTYDVQLRVRGQQWKEDGAWIDPFSMRKVAEVKGVATGRTDVVFDRLDQSRR